jgi:hypothetical protein
MVLTRSNTEHIENVDRLGTPIYKLDQVRVVTSPIIRTCVCVPGITVQYSSTTFDVLHSIDERAFMRIQGDFRTFDQIITCEDNIPIYKYCTPECTDQSCIHYIHENLVLLYKPPKIADYLVNGDYYNAFCDFFDGPKHGRTLWLANQ